MNDDKLNSRNDKMIKQIVELAGTESPSEGFTAGVMQRIEAAQSTGKQPIGLTATFQRPIIRPVAWMWIAFLGVAIVAISSFLASDTLADGNKTLQTLPRFSDLLSKVVNTEVTHIFAIVVIIASCLFMLDLALSHKKNEIR